MRCIFIQVGTRRQGLTNWELTSSCKSKSKRPLLLEWVGRGPWHWRWWVRCSPQGAAVHTTASKSATFTVAGADAPRSSGSYLDQWGWPCPDGTLSVFLSESPAFIICMSPCIVASSYVFAGKSPAGPLKNWATECLSMTIDEMMRPWHSLLHSYQNNTLKNNFIFAIKSGVEISNQYTMYTLFENC